MGLRFAVGGTGGGREREREREREGVDIDTFCEHVVKAGEFLALSLRFDVLFLVP